MSKVDWKINNKNVGLEPDRYILYCFSIINQIADKEFKINLKLEEGKIIFEINIDKETQNTIFSDKKLLKKGEI